VSGSTEKPITSTRFDGIGEDHVGRADRADGEWRAERTAELVRESFPISV